MNIGENANAQFADQIKQILWQDGYYIYDDPEIFIGLSAIYEDECGEIPIAPDAQQRFAKTIEGFIHSQPTYVFGRKVSKPSIYLSYERYLMTLGNCPECSPKAKLLNQVADIYQTLSANLNGGVGERAFEDLERATIMQKAAEQAGRISLSLRGGAYTIGMLNILSRVALNLQDTGKQTILAYMILNSLKFDADAYISLTAGIEDTLDAYDEIIDPRTWSNPDNYISNLEGLWLRGSVLETLKDIREFEVQRIFDETLMQISKILHVSQEFEQTTEIRANLEAYRQMDWEREELIQKSVEEIVFRALPDYADVLDPSNGSNGSGIPSSNSFSPPTTSTPGGTWMAPYLASPLWGGVVFGRINVTPRFNSNFISAVNFRTVNVLARGI